MLLIGTQTIYPSEGPTKQKSFFQVRYDYLLLKRISATSTSPVAKVLFYVSSEQARKTLNCTA